MTVFSNFPLYVQLKYELFLPLHQGGDVTRSLSDRGGEIWCSTPYTIANSTPQPESQPFFRHHS